MPVKSVGRYPATPTLLSTLVSGAARKESTAAKDVVKDPRQIDTLLKVSSGKCTLLNKILTGTVFLYRGSVPCEQREVYPAQKF